MPSGRKTKEEVEVRETFMKELFRKDPDLPMPQANDRFYEEFGEKMRPQRVYSLREEVREQVARSHQKEGKMGTRKKKSRRPMSEETKAKIRATKQRQAEEARLAKESGEPNGVAAGMPAVLHRQVAGNGHKHALIEVKPGTEQVAETVISTLQNQGLFEGRVKHAGDGYVVISKD